MKIQELLESKEYTIEKVNELLDIYDFRPITTPTGLIDNVLIKQFDKVRPYLNCVAILTCYIPQIRLDTTDFNYNILHQVRKERFEEVVMKDILTKVNQYQRSPEEMEQVDKFFELTSKVSNLKYLMISIDPNKLHVRFYAYKEMK